MRDNAADYQRVQQQVRGVGATVGVTVVPVQEL
jgi:hypothetical protein